MALLCKNKKEGGLAGASPVAAPMPKSVSRLREKIDCLEGEYFFVYLSPRGWSDIYSVCFPNWMVVRILSHWMRYFCLYRHRI